MAELKTSAHNEVPLPITCSALRLQLPCRFPVVLPSDTSSHLHRLPILRHLQIVRNGYLPERSIQTGIGQVKVKVPKIRDKSGQGIKFNSALLPPYLRKTRSVEEVLPWLYLKGISTGDFQEALEALLVSDAKGLSASTISRLKSVWEQEQAAWSRRSLANKRYVYIWADGVYFNIRSVDAKQCILVIIGVTELGKKEFIAIEDGYRESEQSWSELLLRIKAQGLSQSPKLAVGDGAL